MEQASSTAGAVGLTNHDLALALLARDPTAPRVAFLRFSPKVRSIVRRHLGSHGDVEDSVQDVFLQLFRSVDSLRNPHAVESFVIAIAVRTARRHSQRARARRHLLVPLSPADDDEHPAAADVGAQHALKRLQGALARVRSQDRTAFVLRFIAGMRVEEIAKLIGTSPPTVRRRFTRAFARLSYFASKDLFLTEYLRQHRE